MYHTFNFDFRDKASIFNAVSKAVLPAETATDILSHKDIGKEMYKSLVDHRDRRKRVDERIHREVSVWPTMKKRNLKTFWIQGKSIKTKIGEILVQLKEEHTLLSRFLFTARNCPELDFGREHLKS